jgi:hypothetical protein
MPTSEGRIPYTELVETCQNEMVREAASNQENKFKGYINQTYQNVLPAVLPDTYIKKEAFITLVAEYTTGTVTVGTGTPGIQGVLTTFTSAYNNAMLKVDGYNRAQRVTYSADTLMQFQNSLTWIEDSGTGLSYSMFQDRYALPSDFAYMLTDNPEDPNVVSRQINGAAVFLQPHENEEFDRNFNAVVGDLWAYTVKWISELPYLFVLSAPESADILSLLYIPQLTTLTEYTTGTVTFNTTTAAVFTGGALLTGNVNTALNSYYIRNDADGTGSSSKWVKIQTVVNGTALTLASGWSYTSGAGITYTISEISKWPARFDDAMLYKAAMIADPDNVQYQKWVALYGEAVNLDKTVEAKRLTSRPLKEFWGMRKR